VPTIFNLLGPLANPAGAPLQLLGVGKRHLQPLLGEALALLGTQRALVIHGEDGLDEVTLAAATVVWETSPEGPRQYRWTPADFGLESIELASIQVSGPEQSASTIRGVLAGRPGPARAIVVANAAAAIWTAGAAETPATGAAMAARAIDTGAASDLLARLASLSHHVAELRGSVRPGGMP